MNNEELPDNIGAINALEDSNIFMIDHSKYCLDEHMLQSKSNSRPSSLAMTPDHLKDSLSLISSQARIRLQQSKKRFAEQDQASIASPFGSESQSC